ncbi:MptD family putative ECF transporter S component [Arachnia propionica]|nr:MptD family putative ECF transporter S component [Arachnia propionica]MDO5084291.1 MptD family putative ECF transporter S component [Arachnia propionica]
MKFTSKELISLGIFTAVFTVIHYVFNMLGAITPALQLIGGNLGIIVNGITFMLFLTRVRHFGLITLFAVLLGLLVTLTGHHPVSMITALLAGLGADALASRGDFRAPLATISSYGVFSLWVVGAYLPLLFMRDELLASYRDQMGPDWAEAFATLFSPPVVILMILLTFLVGLVGGFIGRRALSKHFERAGLA